MKKSLTPTACNYSFRPLAAILSTICLSMIALQPLVARTVREYVEAEDHECYDDMLEEFSGNKILTPAMNWKHCWHSAIIQSSNQFVSTSWWIMSTFLCLSDHIG